MPYIDPEVGRKVYLLRQEAKSLEEAADRLLDDLWLEKGEYISGDYIISVTPTVRFDPATAERNLKPDEFQKILKTVPDSRLAKAVLGEARYKTTQKTYGFTRKVTRVEVD